MAVILNSSPKPNAQRLFWFRVDTVILNNLARSELIAGVAELVYAYVSEAYGESLESSSLSFRTNFSLFFGSTIQIKLVRPQKKRLVPHYSSS